MQKHRRTELILNRKINNRTDLEVTKMIEFLAKYIKTIIIIIHMLKKVEASVSSKISRNENYKI